MRFALRKNVRPGRAPSGSRLAHAVLLPLFVGLACFFPTAQHAQSRPAADARPARSPSTLADYRARVRGAVEPLEELAALYERAAAAGESDEESDTDAGAELEEVEAELEETAPEVLGAVRDSLPPRERVGRGADFIDVDNAWLHEALDEAAEDADEYEKYAAGLRAAAGRLRSLEARLAEAEGGAAEPLDRDAERGRLNAILRSPVFDREVRRQQGNALQNLVKRFVEWVLSLLPKGGPISRGASPRVSTTTQVVVLLLCLAVLAYVARLLWLRRGRGRRSRKPRRGARVVLGERLEADQTVADLLDDAERLALAGDLRGAIRKAYVALLCELGDRGVVRLAQHKTNRDYLSAVRRAASPGLYAEMLPLTFDFEVHWYGLRDATASDWESFKTRCRRALNKSGV
ncbi:MAG: DUF4129 domain-containing protein [Acidobacteria bacterium]|nr:DUF4129 domain-containing protein [Acidobacteriota bacterium]MCA1619767.1 DUF4129 domain-containing protein [Acidobacteriota bacterium]